MNRRERRFVGDLIAACAAMNATAEQWARYGAAYASTAEGRAAAAAAVTSINRTWAELARGAAALALPLPKPVAVAEVPGVH
jgi:hypothetical protein